MDISQNNIIFKGHPREISVNEWVENNSNEISYFLSFPYELWQIIGHGDYVYKYDNVDYNMYLPKQPKEIHSIFSTTLYGEDKAKIKNIFGYNKLNESKELVSLKHEVGIGDEDEFERWNKLTGSEITPFTYTFNFINEERKINP